MDVVDNKDQQSKCQQGFILVKILSALTPEGFLPMKMARAWVLL